MEEEKTSTVVRLDGGEILPDNSDYAVKKRRQWVLKKLLAMEKPYDIYEEWQKLFPGLSEKSFDLDRSLAYRSLEATAETNEEIITSHISFYQDIAKANKKDNPAIAMKALASIERLKKLHAPDVAVQVNNYSNLDLSGLSVDEIKAFLAAKSDDV